MTNKQFRIDNHIIEIELNNNIFKIWYNYNKNTSSFSILYDPKEKKFFGFYGNINNIFTNRQKNILENKLQKLYKKYLKSLIKWKNKNILYSNIIYFYNELENKTNIEVQYTLRNSLNKSIREYINLNGKRNIDKFLKYYC